MFTNIVSGLLFTYGCIYLQVVDTDQDMKMYLNPNLTKEDFLAFKDSPFFSRSGVEFSSQPRPSVSGKLSGILDFQQKLYKYITQTHTSAKTKTLKATNKKREPSDLNPSQHEDDQHVSNGDSGRRSIRPSSQPVPVIRPATVLCDRCKQTLDGDGIEETSNHNTSGANVTSTSVVVMAAPPQPSTQPKTPRIRRIQRSKQEAPSMTFQTSHQTQIHVFKGDIRRLKVAAMVNPTDRELQHIKGLAKEVAMAAGPQLKQECTNRSITHVNRVTITKGCSLPCEHIIHVMSPSLNGLGDEENLLDILFDSYLNCLNTADDKGFSTLAVPPINGGEPILYYRPYITTK